ncbi:MAG: polysaccharide deacetylase family protein, partial [Oscillospiraceae bacterium]|nr:polysaccharide deacetylase family protein [Oscillospiraceae bacterium]
KATFNINSAYLTDPNAAPHRHRHLSADEALKVYDPDYFEVACHGVSHPSLPACDTVTAFTEVADDRKSLERLFCRQIHGMAYPYGTHNDVVVGILKNAGIYYSRTTVSTLKFNLTEDWLRLPATCHHKNPALMELADKFLKLKADYDPKVFYVWGHSYEFTTMDNWYVIENFCEKMANKDDIWYCTNIELYNAWADYQRLERSADGTQIFNPNARSVWVGDRIGNAWEIKPGETLYCE